MITFFAYNSQSNRSQLNHANIITSISNTSSELWNVYTMLPVISLSFYVINAFWVGKQRQQMTAGAFLATSKNSDELFVFNIFVKAGPSTSNTCSA